MNKFYYGILVLSVGCSCDAFAVAKRGPYLRGDLGASLSRNIKNKQDFYKSSGGKKFKDGLASSVGIGYRISKYLRAELSYNRIDNLIYRRNDVSVTNAAGTFSTNYKQKLKLQAGMANVYIDVPLKCGRVVPYLGVGLGYSEIRPGEASAFFKTRNATILDAAKNSKNFSYALMTGIAINMNRKLALDVGYRFQDFGRSKGFSTRTIIVGNGVVSGTFIPLSGPTIQTHSLMAGIRYNF